MKNYHIFIFISALVVFSCSAEKKVHDETPQNEVVIENPTFSEHIATFFYENCTPCHRPGEAGPFSLISYTDISKRSETIRFVVETRYMPPWPADPEYRHFVGERYLRDAQIQTLLNWIDNGMPIGDSMAIPEPPVFPEGSQLGEPDMVIEMKDSFLIRGINVDHFAFIKIPFELPQDTFIRVMEFVPGNRQLAHHMNGHLVNYLPHKKSDIYEGEYMVFPDSLGTANAYKVMGITNDDGSMPEIKTLVCNYLPGVSPVVYPEEIGGFRVRKKATFFMQDMHYGPTAIDQWDKSKVNIFFAKEKPKRIPHETQMGTLGISKIEPPLIIPPDTVMTFVTRYQVPQAISLLMVNPHMHLLGRKFKAYAVTLKKDTIPLVKIDNWDFRWQYYYKFPKMVKIPAGATLVAEGLFDNTEDNPYNPFFPPREIREPDNSMKTTDEMFQFIFTYLPYQEGDENISLENTEL
jgi:hypothetical protein